VKLVLLFVVAFVVAQVLVLVPGLTWLGSVPFLAFLASVALVATVWRTLGEKLVRSASERRAIAALGQVDTPHMRGRLGAAMQDAGRTRAAIEHLEAAASGEPDVLEWRWRLARALSDTGRDEQALERVRALVEQDEEFAYGRALLLRARLAARAGHTDEAIAACERFEHNHGSEPEGLYELACVLAARGDTVAAKAAFARAARAAVDSAAFKRRSDPWLVWRARWRALVG
jgi:tetratricopeptide (TPR) repeat protein